jgi:hypothetical protein
LNTTPYIPVRALLLITGSRKSNSLISASNQWDRFGFSQAELSSFLTIKIYNYEFVEASG